MRLHFLYELMEKENLDVLVLNPGPSLYHLTGVRFHLMERPVVLFLSPEKPPLIVLPSLEVNSIQSALPSLQWIDYNDNPDTWHKAFEAASQQLDLQGKTIGVESTRLRFLEVSLLMKAAPTSHLVPADHLLGQLRVRKTTEEIEKIRTAVKIAERALQATLPAIRPGVSERDIAGELTIQTLRAGSDANLPFEPIVCSGANTANPHAVPSDRVLQVGDIVLIDWGASFQGYCADLTRVFTLGPVAPDLKAAYEIVLAANRAARSLVAPGKTAGDIDSAARSLIERAGYGPYFTHRTGHGLGLEDHEMPYIYGENQQALAEGMVFTIEPGIYLPGLGGIRIEDDVVVTSEGSETLSDLTREFLNLLE
jgi:Xaa-Pro dipeptidase